MADLTTRITHRETQIDIACVTAVKHAMSAVQLAVEQGNDLIAAKAIVGNASRGTYAKGEKGWEQWVVKNFPKSYRLATDYMRLSEKVKQQGAAVLRDVKSIREAFRVLGLLPEVETEPKQLGSISVSPIVSRLNFVAEWVARSSDEIKSWEDIRRQELKIQLQPVVELFQKL